MQLVQIGKDGLRKAWDIKRLRYTAIGIAIVLVLWTVLAWLLVPVYVKRIAVEQVEQRLGRKLEIGKIGFAPLSLTLTADDVTLYEADKQAKVLTLKQAVLNLSLSSAFHQALVMDELRLVTPSLHLERISAGPQASYNFSDILARVAAMPKSDTPFRFALNNFHLQDGAIQFDDRALGKQIKVEALQVALPFISNFPRAADSDVLPAVSAKVNGAPFSMKGRTRPFSTSLDTSLALDLEQVDLPSYVAYSPVPLPFKLEGATLTTKLDLVFDRKQQRELLLTGSVDLNGIKLAGMDGEPLLQAAGVHAQLQHLSVLSGNAVLDKLHLEKPELWLALDKQGRLNWNALFAPEAKKSAAPKVVENQAADKAAAKPGNAPTFGLHDFSIAGGRIHWGDAANASPAQQLALQQIQLQANNISTVPDVAPAKLTLAAGGERGEQLTLQGQLQAAPAHFEGEAALSGIALEDFQPYLNKTLAAKLSGKLEAKSKLMLHGGDLKLEQAELKLADVALKPAAGVGGGVAFKSLALDKLELDTGKRELKMADLRLDGLRADLNRDAQGKLNLQKLVLPADGNKAPSAGKAAQGPVWKAQLDAFRLDDGGVTFADNSVSPAVNLSVADLKLDVAHLRSDLGQAIDVALQAAVNGRGRLSLKGQAAPKLANVKLALDGQSLPVANFFPYVAQHMNASLTRGTATAKGQISLVNPLSPSLQAGYDGNLVLNDFHLLENGTTDDFLKWQLVGADGISAKYTGSQTTVVMKKLTLSNFFARAELSDKGRLNLKNLAKNDQAPALTANQLGKQAGRTLSGTNVASIAVPAKPAAIAAKTVIRIGQTVISGGRINYTDNFIKPNYSANLTSLAGTIGAIASDSTQTASIDLSGKIDDDAPLAISGTLNPLASPLLLDIKGSASDIELTRLTPYAAKYAGYAIEKGKLSMQASYHVENQMLQAQNTLRVDQLTFGERIDSPSATKLPVTLAVALLRDNNGQINVDLPISGSLSDPQFSVGGLIGRVILNLITKAVTSPFALLGSMFGGGEELGYTEFAPGQSVLSNEAQAKLDQLATALKNRSGLKLDIAGRVEPASDTDGLKHAILESKLKLLKLQQMRGKGDSDIKLATVTLDAQERQRYMEEVYRGEKFDKPRNVIGIAKTLPTAEAEQLLLQHTEVSEEALRALAQARADSVLEYLEQSAGISKDRMYLIAPRLSADGIKDKGSPNRVDFALK